MEILLNSTRPKAIDQFAEDVRNGLTSFPKTLPSKYFYDDKGSQLFAEIMKLKEYYLTDSEFEIFNFQKEDILKVFSDGVESFNIIELGSGNGEKTKVLLDHFVSQQAKFKYTPLDISDEAMCSLCETLDQELPSLNIEPKVGDYHYLLDDLKLDPKQRNIVFFLGANIGNYTPQKASWLYNKIYDALTPGDMVFTGFDLKKDPKVILDAYNDSLGVTKAFNLNLLERLNREFGADFIIANYDHYPYYDVVTGEAKSYIMSRKPQTVTFTKLDLEVKFAAWEYIHTEISRKYSIDDISLLAKESGFEVQQNFLDCKWYFTNSLWVKR